MNINSTIQRDKESLDRADKAGIALWREEQRRFLNKIKLMVAGRW